jgi:hypothetical protein
VDATEDRDGDGIAESKFELDLSGDPQIFDFPVGSNVHMIAGGDFEETIALLELMIKCVLKALDLPYSFFSEDFTNWFGSRAAVMHFETLAEPKRAELIELCDEITQWRLGMAIANGEIENPPADLDWENTWWEWVPRGYGWFDPLKEVTGARAGVASGFVSPIAVCKSMGVDWQQILKDRVIVEEAYKKAGLTLDYTMGSSSSTAIDVPFGATPEDAGIEVPEPVAPGMPPGAEDGEAETEEEETGDE